MRDNRTNSEDRATQPMEAGGRVSQLSKIILDCLGLFWDILDCFGISCIILDYLSPNFAEHLKHWNQNKVKQKKSIVELTSDNPHPCPPRAGKPDPQMDFLEP